MKSRTLLFVLLTFVFMSYTSRAISEGDEKEKSFNREKDLLLVQFDCKTDVDDLQTVIFGLLKQVSLILLLVMMISR